MNKQKIKVNNNVLYKNKTIEVRGDVIVPDIKPDIVSIINSNGNAYIYKKEITTSRVRIDGNLDAHIIYLSDNGETRSIQTTLNFIETMEDTNITEQMLFDYDLRILNMETKILNERKITLVANIEMNGILKKVEEIEMIDDISEMKDVEKMEDNIDIRNFIGVNTAKTSLKENLKIEENDEIAEILKTDINIINSESKMSYNKILAKAEANVQVIYLTEDDRVNIASGIFPIMSFIDMENVKEEYSCNIEHKIKNMLFTPNSKEQHSILVQVEFEVQCEVFEKRKISVIQDIYGTKNNINCKKNKMCVDICNNDETTDKINIEEKIFIEDISKVIDIDCFPKIIQKKELNDITNYEGEICATVLYEAENKRGLCSKDVKIPFIVKREKSEQLQLRMIRKEFSLSNENVNIQIELETTEMMKRTKELELIQEIEVEENNDENLYSMIVYFIKPEDTLWNIGKKFKVSVDNICKYNNIENSKIIPGNKLYIVR